MVRKQSPSHSTVISLNANTRPLTILAQDPAVKAGGRVLTTQIDIPAEQFSNGPWGFRVQVVDYDSSTRVFYKPRLATDYFTKNGYLDPYEKIAATNPESLVGDPQFHAQNAYAIVMRILARFEFALGRRVSWSFPTHQLKVIPHAFADANAFYSEADEALMFGYFVGNSGQIVCTSLSHDIIAHETSHALVDGLRTSFTEASSADQAAFHEGFSDVVALLSVFALPAVVDAVLEIGNSSATKNVSGRRLIKANALTIPALQDSILLGLAQEMGEELSMIRGQPLRNSAKLAPRSNYLTDTEYEEPHRRGEILVAAILQAFLQVLHARIQGLDGGGSGWLDRERVVEECAKSADHLLTMSIRALDYCGPIHITFADFLSALLTADFETCPNDSQYRYREKLKASFKSFGIIPASDEGSDEKGMWRRCDAELSYIHNHHRSLQSDHDEVFRFIWENRKQLGVTDEVFTRVISVRPCQRTAPDGIPVQETVAEYIQIANLRADELGRFKIAIPSDMPADTEVVIRGGGTLIFDEFGRMKFSVTSRIDHQKHQSERIKYLWENGAFRSRSSALRFAELHRTRSTNRNIRHRERWL